MTTTWEPYLKKLNNVLIVLIILCIIFFSLISGIVSVFILDTFQTFEEKQMESRMIRFSENLNNSIHYMGKTVVDYAVWDDMALYSEGKYPSFYNEGMSRESFIAIDIDIVGILNESGYLLYIDDYSNPVGDSFPLRSELSVYFNKTSPLLRTRDKDDALSSLVFHQGTLSGILVSHPIQYHTTGNKGNGYVIMGKYFKPSYLNELSIILDYPVYLVTDNDVNEIFIVSDEYLSTLDIRIQVINQSSIAGFLKISDPVSGENTNFGVTYPRNIYKEGFSTLSSYLLLILVIMGVFSIISLIGLRFYLKHAEKSAKLAQEKNSSYQMIISEIEDGYFRSNPDGIIEAVSPSTVSMLGFSSPDEVIGKPLSDFYQNPDDRIILRQLLFHDHQLKNHSIVLKRVDGSLIYISANVHLIYAEDGMIAGIEGIAHDNTDILLAKKTVHEGESFYRLIFESANIGLFQSTPDGELLLVNPVFAFMAGYSGPEQMIKEVITISGEHGLNPDDYEKLKDELDKHGAVRNLEISLKKRDGSSIWLNINVVVIKDFSDQTVAIFGTAIDITEKKKIEDWLVESQQKFKSLFYFSPVAIFVYNTSGSLIDSNSAAISLFGFSEKSIPESEPLFFKQYLTFEEKRDLESGKVIQKEILMDFDKLREKYYVPPSCSGMGYLDLMVTPIPGPDHQTEWYLVQIDDITERKKAEISRNIATERLKEAEVIAKLGHWELDFKKNTLFWSNEVYSIFEKDTLNFSPSYESFLHMLHPDDRHLVDRAFQLHITTKIPYDIIHRIKLSDNRIKYVREISKTEWDDQGIAIRSVGITHDITSAREKELALRESEQKYRQIVTNVSLGFILFEFTDTGEPGRIIDLNPKAQEMIQKTLLDILIGDFNIQDFLPISGSAYVRNLTYIDADICMFKSGIIRSNHDVLPVQVTLDIFRLENSVVGLAIIEDITQKNQYEEERIKLIKQIERNLAELSILNDGIRNPLTIIMLLVDELEEKISEPVLKQVRNIDELIRQLDKRWIESDKILHYLQKHHHILTKK